MKKLIKIIANIWCITVIGTFIYILITSCFHFKTEHNIETYILNNIDSVKYNKTNNTFSLLMDDPYYTDITINKDLYIICWGDRNHYMWNYKYDKMFECNDKLLTWCLEHKKYD